MKVIAFYDPEVEVNKAINLQILSMLRFGVLAHGDEFEIATPKDIDDAEFDVATFVGLQARSKRIVRFCQKSDKRVLIFDKGLIRTRNKSRYCRVSIDSGAPLAYLMRVNRPSDRWDALGVDVAPLRPVTKDGHIVYANNSQKNHDFWDLGLAADYTDEVFRKIRKHSDRPLVYRPKRSLLESCRPIDGVELSTRGEDIEDALAGAHCLVTYGSSCAVNAILAGVPAIALGPCAARPVCGDSIGQVNDPPFPTEEERHQWLCNLAYCQWTSGELSSGKAWDFIKKEMKATAPGWSVK